MPATVRELRANLGPNVKFREPLSGYTNFKIGGRAQFLLVATATQEAARAVQVAGELKLPLLVLGGGSNVLVSDRGFPGLVVIMRASGWSIEATKVTAEAGVNLAFLVQKTITAGLTGFEPLVAVPGTVGGAVYGNAGIPQVAKGFIGDFVTEVTVCRGDTVVTVPRQQCAFGYRDSAFKHASDVILQAAFELAPGNAAESHKLVKCYLEARKSQPYHQPSSGCIFTNVPITDADEVRRKFAGEEKLEQFISRGQLPASWLIDRAGLKGKTIGAVQVSPNHANYLVNLGGGKAAEVVQMISYIKQRVRDQFGIQLQEEVRYLGF